METRVLVALEDEYRAYREVLAAGVQATRPGVRVVTAVPASLDEEVPRFHPQMIICSGSGVADIGDAVTCIELSMDPSRPTVVHLDGQRFEQVNPTFDTLLAIVDETRRLTEAKQRDEVSGSAADDAAPTTG